LESFGLSPVCLAKAKVAGSNPVFRSNSKGPDAADFASAPGPSLFALRPVSDPAPGPRSYGLGLSDTSQRAALLAPSVGVEWAGDHFTIGIAPRVEILIGSVRSWAVSLPLSLFVVLVPVMLSSGRPVPQARSSPPCAR
jgi:hypothetical protein